MVESEAGQCAPPEEERNVLQRLASRLTLSEWLSTLIAVASLVISVLTYFNTDTTAKLTDAVNNLFQIVTQLKRQADEQQEQIVILKDQTGTLRASVIAQEKSNEIAVASRRPSVALSSIDPTGIGRMKPMSCVK